jgi:hypothetical protein
MQGKLASRKHKALISHYLGILSLIMLGLIAFIPQCYNKITITFFFPFPTLAILAIGSFDLGFFLQNFKN